MKMNIKQMLLSVLFVMCLLMCCTGCSDNGNLLPTEEVDFVESEDLIVIHSFTSGGNFGNIGPNFVLKNNSDKPILDLKLAYIMFDSNGISTITMPEGYEIADKRAVNIMPGEKEFFNYLGSCGDEKYVKATPIYIKYSDETEWTASNVSVWQKETVETFDVSAYKAEIEALRPEGEKALINDYVDIFDVYIKDNSTRNQDLFFKVANKSDLFIKDITLYTFQFDENGFPVKDSSSSLSYYYINGNIVKLTSINLESGYQCSYSGEWIIEEKTKNIKYVVESVTFADDTTWENPYLYEWIITNHSLY